MTPRDVVRTVIDGGRPPYVPWHFSFTAEAADRLADHYGDAWADVLGNHLLWFGGSDSQQAEVAPGHFMDYFGVKWNRTVDKDIGVIEELRLPEPTLKDFSFPNPRDRRFFDPIAGAIERDPDLYRVYGIGFSLYERAWTLRGMENLFIDLIEHPEFVHELFDALVDFNIEQLDEACRSDIDAIYFGDDWGQQHGLQMGKLLWDEFVRPAVARMYQAAHDRGKAVFIHSCGDVDELFDDLSALGVNCFNPFQPEVMDVWSLLPRYRGRMAFHGGLSTQRTLPRGTVGEVEAEAKALLDLGRDGSYLFAPAHAVEGDVPVENMVAFIETAHRQAGYK